MHDEATAAKFTAGLKQEVDPIYDEVELGNDCLFPEIVGEVVDVVVGESGLTAALGVPNDPFACAVLDGLLNRLGREDLRVTHHVFLVASIGSMHVGDAEFQQELETVSTEE